MGDMADDFKIITETSKEKRSNNRDQSAQYLAKRDIPFESKNGGAHLIVEGVDCYIDLWPGTGKWITRKGHKGFGVRNLVKFIDE